MTVLEQREQAYQDELEYLERKFPDKDRLSWNQVKIFLELGEASMLQDAKLSSLFTKRNRYSYITLPALARYLAESRGKKITTQGAATPKGGMRKYTTRV